MAKNEARRRALADAGLDVLAREGSRGLTHRAVDEAAAVPAGTTSNYFRSREALIAGLVDRIGERLAPSEADLAARAGAEPSPELFADYLRDIVRRLTSEREVTLALFELRLESTRRPELAAVLGAWQRAGFEADVAFNTGAGLPGGAREIALFHYAIDGLLLDRLTSPIDPGTSTDEVVDALVAGLLPRG
ncbi:TetR/AcrR family transcriptional regulator [Agromyces mediolanus]|uniref:TetR family transcriptional regulator n=1 Tax=Agromyces mediolanus TaxID=41986 RepID=A0A918CJX8_AGRME|nr:TetR/AcrR family transcriptional regulator [Agromyces mediolanus]GGR26916.1 TetR family transcriptional regulator [Agromyces mediolanus]GLJ71848.1 TetR family transcriptional regulator [Agromyces mediolanus]